MMKRKTIISIIFILSLMCTQAFASDMATPTSSSVFVNGYAVTFDAYLIDDNNYFKLRDIAYVLSYTEKQFEVGYDETSNAISLTSGQSYTSVGGELASGGTEEKSYSETSSKILKDGVETQFSGYLIDGNNYFKLRDIGAAFDFSVEWDSSQNAILIDTSRGYISENASANNVPSGFTNGYEPAEFSKYNSPTSTNGLGGTNIYIDGVIYRTSLASAGEYGNIIFGYITDHSGHDWVAILHHDLVVSQNEFDSIIGKPIVLLGSYGGFSETEKMPVIYMSELCLKETGEIKYGIQKILDLTDDETNNTNEAEDGNTVNEEYDLSTPSKITSYLSEHYDSVDTEMGTWNFTFSVLENDMEMFPKDYTIWVEYDLGQMNDLQYSNKYSESQKAETKQQLKDFMKTIADDLLSKIDNKKIECSYHYSYYKYEYIQEGLQVLEYCTWINYEPGGSYSDTPVSTFRWYPDYDEEIW